MSLEMSLKNRLTILRLKGLCSLADKSLCLLFLRISLILLLASAANLAGAEVFSSSGQKNPELIRNWIGPEFYANRLEDWRLNGERIECLTAASNRYLYWLTREIKNGKGDVRISFKASVPRLPERTRSRNFIGLRLGIKSQGDDYREAALSGQGLEVGVTTEGLLFIGELESVSPEEKQEEVREALEKGVVFRLEIASGDQGLKVNLTVIEPEKNKVLDELQEVSSTSEKIRGGLSLVASLPEVRGSAGQAIAQFEALQAGGEMLANYPERTWGPVVLSLYTLSQNLLKINLQLIPGSLSENSAVKMQIKQDGNWNTVAVGQVDKESWTVLFKIPDWKGEEDIDYRIATEDKSFNSPLPFYQGKIRKLPLDQKQLVMAILNNNQEDGFPHTELVNNLKKHNPDIIFFAGNQVYGRPASLWQENVTLGKLTQEYFRQWLLFAWAFSDLLKDRPAVLIPDAHDYFQLKLWGNGGRTGSAENLAGTVTLQDRGGFLLPAEFIRLVLKTQTSHLPDSLAWEISDSNLKSFYAEISYGGLSLAIIDDRTFKSAPQLLLPGAQIKNGWAFNPDFDLKTQSRVKGAQLLGQKQLELLERWASDWSNGIWMKAALSSSIWVSLITLPKGALGDEDLFRLPLLQPGEYPQNDRQVGDFNTGGWPPSGRDEAIKILRKAFAIHLAGSGGPACSLKYGLEKYGDAVWAFQPSPIINSWPARWFPRPASRTARPKDFQPTGNFEDAFGNKFNLRAVSNPYGSEVSPVYRGAPGYGIVRFERESRQIVFENWPRNVDPDSPQAKTYSGWPLKFQQLENDGRKAVAYLPTLKFKGIKNPVVQVVEEKSGEVVYTLRISGDEFRPPLYNPGIYTIRCGEPGTSSWKELRKISSLLPSVKKVLVVDLSPLGIKN
jgi:hypothetical protein